ncbi:hypothetical protein CIG75_18595 [Tumebacillus algifaecis]|uniref:HTH cro/C1-type domain-containing protein n=1 Tax=Tumebacillus algifaecis TaxID=1214604 RepID=A0A223D573_9BACL|nr:helix-turn-helix transcriptional regulator [Tumebacillus algifaecis]ASS76749.1 hypothetical protein CIG75_18595 [Tumebacillus algifaecis]
MSTSEHKMVSEMENVNLLRRIIEIMYEKGETIRGFSSRLHMSRETLRLILVAERPVSPSEVEEIANGLGVSVARLKQMDTYKQQQELEAFFNSDNRTKPMYIRNTAFAEELVEMALGSTERGFSLNNLGRIYYSQGEYEKAYNVWTSAMDYAKKLNEQYKEKRLLHLVTASLMLCYTIFKEYSSCHELLQMVETVFVDDAETLAMAQYTRMIMQEDRGNIQKAMEHAYKSLEFFKQIDSNEQIAIALLNAAHYEYIIRNYTESAKLLSEAMHFAESFEDTLALIIKEYVKSLIQLKDYTTAIQLIEEYASLTKQYPEYWGKLQIMYTVAKDDPSYAASVSRSDEFSRSVRFYACKCLMEFYFLKNDAETAMSYYERSRIFSNTKSEFMNERGF